MKSHHSLFDITVEKLAETDAAVLVHDGDKSKAVWLPKSQIEIEPAEVGGLFIVTAPEWLLADKGLV
jgi:hypothetical protein